MLRSETSWLLGYVFQGSHGLSAFQGAGVWGPIATGWPLFAAEILPPKKTVPWSQLVAIHLISIDFKSFSGVHQKILISRISGRRGLKPDNHPMATIVAEIHPPKTPLLDPI